MATLAGPAAEAAGKVASVQYLEDPGHTLSLEDVRSPGLAGRWRPSPTTTPNFLYTSSRYWLRFELVPDHPGEWSLRVSNQLLERVTLYVPGPDGTWRELRNGALVPISQRPARAGRYVFPIRFTTTQPLTVYLAAESYMPLEIPLSFADITGRTRDIGRQNFLFGIFSGVLLLTLLFSVALGLALRRRVLLYYAAYILFLLMLALGNEGFTQSFLTGEWPWWNQRELAMYGAAAILFYALFVRYFLLTRETTPWLDKVLVAATAVSSVRLVWFLFAINQPVAIVAEYAIPVVNLITLLIAFRCVRKVRGAPFFLAGAFFFNLSAIVLILQGSGQLYLGAWVEHSIYFGMLTEVVFLGFGVVYWLFSQLSEREQQRALIARYDKMSALGQMASGIAHEINNPLTIIGGNAQLLERYLGRPDFSHAEVRQAANAIHLTTQRISRIVRSLRSFARDAKTQELERASVRQILDDTLALCQERFATAGVALEIEVPEKDSELRCRPVDLSQVLLNLMNNAFDAVEATSRKRVAVQARANATGIEITVIDSGPGVPPSLLERIFDPFFTTKPVGRGTGLGLSISKAIVEDHGGKLDVRNEPQGGARFTISLPLTL